MKFLAATALAVCTAMAGCAPLHPAQQSFAPVKPPEPPPPRLRAVLPPLEYNHPYGGVLMITRGDKEVMTKECPKTSPSRLAVPTSILPPIFVTSLSQATKF